MKQHTKKKWLARLLVFAMLISVLSVGSFDTARAADIQNFQITGTYGQTEARSMLAMVNTFRTGNDAWQWNENDTEKVQVSGLSALTYDYNLEKIAMQRAIEIALSFSHTRPNGEQCFSAYTDGYRAMGENIAAGSSTAATAFEQWQETNEPYSGQGHRRNMLSGNFGAIGIGHFVYNGIHYWVQEFGDRAVEPDATSANDSETAVIVPIDTAQITSKAYTPSVKSYQLAVSQSESLPTISLGLRTSQTWPASLTIMAAVTETPIWTVKDAAIATISDTNILAVAPGTTSLVCTINGETIEIPITVADAKPQAMDLSKAAISLSAFSFVYDGKAKTPAVTVTLNGTKLTLETDYTVSYSNNTNVGTAKVTITGKGKYTGTASTTFKITKEETKPEKTDLSDALIDLYPESFTYDKKAKTPAVTVVYGETELKEGIDYTVTYSNNTNAGTAKVTITGKGNYTGTATETFVINKAKNKLTVNKTSYALKYSKKPQKLTLKASATAGKITYSSNKAKVKVNKKGKVTIAKNFTGKATITIKVTDKNYKTATKKVVINVKKK